MRPKTRRKTRQRVKRRTKNYSKKRKNTRKKNYSKKVVQEGGMLKLGQCFGIGCKDEPRQRRQPQTLFIAYLLFGLYLPSDTILNCKKTGQGEKPRTLTLVQPEYTANRSSVVSVIFANPKNVADGGIQIARNNLLRLMDGQEIDATEYQKEPPHKVRLQPTKSLCLESNLMGKADHDWSAIFLERGKSPAVAEKESIKQYNSIVDPASGAAGADDWESDLHDLQTNEQAGMAEGGSKSSPVNDTGLRAIADAQAAKEKDTSVKYETNSDSDPRGPLLDTSVQVRETWQGPPAAPAPTRREILRRQDEEKNAQRPAANFGMRTEAELLEMLRGDGRMLLQRQEEFSALPNRDFVILSELHKSMPFPGRATAAQQLRRKTEEETARVNNEILKQYQVNIKRLKEKILSTCEILVGMGVDPKGEEDLTICKELQSAVDVTGGQALLHSANMAYEKATNASGRPGAQKPWKEAYDNYTAGLEKLVTARGYLGGQTLRDLDLSHPQYGDQPDQKKYEMCKEVVIHLCSAKGKRLTTKTILSKRRHSDRMAVLQQLRNDKANLVARYPTVVAGSAKPQSGNVMVAPRWDGPWSENLQTRNQSDGVTDYHDASLGFGSSLGALRKPTQLASARQSADTSSTWKKGEWTAAAQSRGDDRIAAAAAAAAAADAANEAVNVVAAQAAESAESGVAGTAAGVGESVEVPE